MQSGKKLTQAKVRWDKNTPIATDFDDFYFHQGAGLDEARHVFLNGNQLESRFSDLKAPSFTIAETGFGTGINFLATRQLWLDKAPENARLHFISIEKYPLSRDDLVTALSHWPALQTGSKQLLAQYPEPVSGFHRISLDNGRIQLTLILMDATEACSQLSARVDAWFLDGFTPSKNLAMWNINLYRQLARLSHPNATLSTFTIAGFVRRDLQAAGFEIKRVPGFGRKLEMISARYKGNNQPTTSDTPWFDLPWHTKNPASAVVIGAGIAGCSTAFALASRGIPVTLLERNADIAQEGSGNHQGALYAKLPVSHNTQGQLHLSGLLYSRHLLQQQDPNQTYWSDCGLLQLATNEKERLRQQALLEKTEFDTAVVQGVSAAQASTIAGTQISQPGLFMPQGGWVSPVDFCRQLICHPLITLRLNCTVENLKQDTDEQHWQLQLQDKSYLNAETVILCSAAQARQFSQTAFLPVKPIRGQTSLTPCTGTPLNTVVCADGYISPAFRGRFCFGATFDLHNLDLAIKHEDHRKNLNKLHSALPEVADQVEVSALEGRVAYRCSTSDYLPIAGPVPDYETFIENYAKLRVDRKWKYTGIVPKHLKGLYTNIGHGSKGLITAPVCSEMIAAMITAEPQPVENFLLDAVNPARFIIKNLIRKTI
ncbi:MAG: bifunctional tRNA (5-methylaminomethyl-2-thiouridine)(34)-methyltransferase MnmD/FAD-dependent 5-carboxymethylaminomethyl-2-thiouridine(34) oxidoreductase MnmC [Pontibacterium sp.]